MSDIGSKLRNHWLEVAWGVFSAANILVIFLLSDWETIPFHFVWVSLTLVYGLRLWKVRTTWWVLAAVMVVTAVALTWSIEHSNQQIDELSEVPLMAAMFVAMVWHAEREKRALRRVRELADTEHRLLEREREFVRNASHELRTPITVARGHVELLRAAASDPQTADDADVALEELDRLARISERLLLLAAAEDPRFVRPAPLELGAFVADRVRRWRAAAPRRWAVDAAGGSWVDADADRLGTALDALIENAVKFTDEGDAISLSAGRRGDEAFLEVSDSGDGIAPDTLGRIFDRFARADGSVPRSAGGTGLGLAIVRAIAEAHRGSVRASSEPGKGSTFEIRLPISGARPRPPASGRGSDVSFDGSPAERADVVAERG